MAENKEVVITYDTLFDIVRRERYRKELQPLELNFFPDVVKYLHEKQAILKSQEEKDSVFSAMETEKTRTQLCNARKILKDLYEMREAKIIQCALFHARSSAAKAFDFSAMLPEEIELFNAVCSLLAKFRSGILGQLLAGKTPSMLLQEKPKSLKTEALKEVENAVRLACSVPQFVGPDMNTYGPFREGEKITLPGSIADMLIKNGHATMEGQNENS